MSHKSDCTPTVTSLRRTNGRRTHRILICLTTTCGAPMLETYHKLQKKPSTIAELRTILHKIWNDLPQKPVAKAVQNFRKRLQACTDNAGGHFDHFILHVQYCFSDCNLACEQLSMCSSRVSTSVFLAAFS